MTKPQKTFSAIALFIAVSLITIGSGFAWKKEITTVKTENMQATPAPLATPVTYRILPSGSTDTTNWNTYTDPILKYTIKYPNTVQTMGVTPGREADFYFKDDPKLHPFFTLEILDRGSLGYDAHHGYEASEGNCVGKGNDCFSITNISPSIHFVRIQNAYGIEAPFNPNASDYYLTDKNKTGDVIRIIAPLASLPNKKEQQAKMSTFKEMIATFHFNRG